MLTNSLPKESSKTPTNQLTKQSKPYSFGRTQIENKMYISVQIRPRKYLTARESPHALDPLRRFSSGTLQTVATLVV